MAFLISTSNISPSLLNTLPSNTLPSKTIECDLTNPSIIVTNSEVHVKVSGKYYTGSVIKFKDIVATDYELTTFLLNGLKDENVDDFICKTILSLDREKLIIRLIISLKTKFLTKEIEDINFILNEQIQRPKIFDFLNHTIIQKENIEDLYLVKAKHICSDCSNCNGNPSQRAPEERCYCISLSISTKEDNPIKIIIQQNNLCSSKTHFTNRAINQNCICYERDTPETIKSIIDYMNNKYNYIYNINILHYIRNCIGNSAEFLFNCNKFAHKSNYIVTSSVGLTKLRLDFNKYKMNNFTIFNFEQINRDNIFHRQDLSVSCESIIILSSI